jgi:hypothetical protein
MSYYESEPQDSKPKRGWGTTKLLWGCFGLLRLVLFDFLLALIFIVFCVSYQLFPSLRTLHSPSIVHSRSLQSNQGDPIMFNTLGTLTPTEKGAGNVSTQGYGRIGLVLVRGGIILLFCHSRLYLGRSIA